MNTHTDMWVEFAKSFGMLFAVLAFFLLALYLVRRVSGRFGARDSAELIKVLSVHHLSPKEKLVLVSVQDQSVLIGVSPAGISSLARFGEVQKTVFAPSEKTTGFQTLLKKNLMKENSTHNMPLENNSSNSRPDSGKGERS
ncbi:flagellar biosynthetic protein FliO [Desulfobacter postgatei]|uniref:flagellar biosynthetic protein FliO n=1 Tax=Desulfobacter postgatei TaxID=2293 RepID=UPI002A358687|nr:flagellar biosynthetic protein FliO [Desulfobacter postgatei]MDX9964799.1 flagellar biosynthetic protein FliO [Desulfobacter postgatei]